MKECFALQKTEQYIPSMQQCKSKHKPDKATKYKHLSKFHLTDPIALLITKKDTKMII